jgi:hypothetical protein
MLSFLVKRSANQQRVVNLKRKETDRTAALQRIEVLRQRMGLNVKNRPDYVSMKDLHSKENNTIQEALKKLEIRDCLNEIVLQVEENCETIPTLVAKCIEKIILRVEKKFEAVQKSALGKVTAKKEMSIPLLAIRKLRRSPGLNVLL